MSLSRWFTKPWRSFLQEFRTSNQLQKRIKSGRYIALLVSLIIVLVSSIFDYYCTFYLIPLTIISLTYFWIVGPKFHQKAEIDVSRPSPGIQRFGKCNSILVAICFFFGFFGTAAYWYTFYPLHNQNWTDAQCLVARFAPGFFEAQGEVVGDLIILEVHTGNNNFKACSRTDVNNKNWFWQTNSFGFNPSNYFEYDGFAHVPSWHCPCSQLDDCPKVREKFPCLIREERKNMEAPSPCEAYPGADHYLEVVWGEGMPYEDKGSLFFSLGVFGGLLFLGTYQISLTLAISQNQKWFKKEYQKIAFLEAKLSNRMRYVFVCKFAPKHFFRTASPVVLREIGLYLES
mmetsp:Transcript_59625/g.67822  ORF Transcript_59625/g.67822 Transcript_59625/m.67822 type:complete len:344 (+) Transcript_59625:37-1068(+)